MKKKKSLLDSFLFHEARKEVDGVTGKDGRGSNGIVTGYGRGTDGVVTVKGRYNTGIIPVQGRYKDTVPDGRGTDGVRVLLPPKQLLIYDWFLRRGFTGFFSNPLIAKETGIPLETVRKTMRKFKKEELVFAEYDPGIKAFAYRINTEISVVRTDGVVTGFGRGTDGVVTVSDPSLNSSSSSLYKEPTTPSGNSDPDIETVLNTDPEFGYWRQKGLTARQIKNWMQTAGCGPHSVLEYLRYCRFDMLEEDTENTRPVENVFNWFFRILEKSGAYPKPKNYTSFAETQLKNERRFAQEQEKQIQELRTLRQKKEQLKQDKAFEEMMNDPDSDLYKKCLANLSDFHKKRAARKGKAFETAMRKEFEKISGAADNG